MDKKKICPFMTSAFQYDDHATDHGQIQYCIERLCMAWGMVKSIECGNYEGVEYNATIEEYGCKLIDKEEKNG